MCMQDSVDQITKRWTVTDCCLYLNSKEGSQPIDRARPGTRLPSYIYVLVRLLRMALVGVTVTGLALNQSGLAPLKFGM